MRGPQTSRVGSKRERAKGSGSVSASAQHTPAHSPARTRDSACRPGQEQWANRQRTGTEGGYGPPLAHALDRVAEGLTR